MKVLVTGGKGFLGRSVVSLLRKRGIEALSLDLPQTNPDIPVDLLSDQLSTIISQVDPDVIIHLAGVQYLKKVRRRDREAFFQENVEMARRLAAASRDLAALTHFVFVSTDMVYGKQKESPIPNTAETSPLGPYGESKLQSERILEAAMSTQGVTLTIFRPRLIAGKGRLGTIQLLKSLIVRGLPVPIFGTGRNRYQMVSKEDVAEAIYLSIIKRVGGIFNLGSDNPPIVRTLISETIKSRKSKSKLIFFPNKITLALLRIADILDISPLSPEQFEIAGFDYVLDTEETKRLLQWSPTSSDSSILIDSLK